MTYIYTLRKILFANLGIQDCQYAEKKNSEIVQHLRKSNIGFLKKGKAI